jgi:hypothetical protein
MVFKLIAPSYDLGSAIVFKYCWYEIDQMA